MDGSMADLNKLIKAMSTFDDEALILMSNKGLFRRANKDLQKLMDSDSISISDDFTAVVHSETVSLSEEGPIKSKCTCGASGVCRHILALCLYLRDLDTDVEPVEKRPDVLMSEFSSMGMSALIQWGGKSTLKKSFKLLNENDIQIEIDKTVSVSFLKNKIQCKLFSELSLDSSVVNVSDDKFKEVVVAAVLACKREAGVELSSYDIQPSESYELSGEQVLLLKDIQALIMSLIDVGILSVTQGILERFSILSTDCQTRSLIRLSRLLKGLSEEVGLILQKHSEADNERYLSNLIQCYTLCESLIYSKEHKDMELMGVARSQYKVIDMLELNCLGSYKWITRSDYQGITTIFWSPSNNCICTWSNSRPISTLNDFDPEAEYKSGAPWNMGERVAGLSGKIIRLENAQLNHNSRLSSSAQTKASIIGRWNLNENSLNMPLFTDFSELESFALSKTNMGLKLVNPSERIVMLKPKKWLAKDFDQVEQKLFWWVEDEQGEVLKLEVPFTKNNKNRVDNLEKLDVNLHRLWGIVGYVQVSMYEISVEPLIAFSIGSNHDFDVIELDFKKSLSVKQSKLTALLNRFRTINRGLPVNPGTHFDYETIHPLERQLQPLKELLLKCSELGKTSSSNYLLLDLKKQSKAFGDSGLMKFSEMIDAYIESDFSSEKLIRLGWVIAVTKQALLRVGKGSNA
jgi:hypothetical protein